MSKRIKILLAIVAVALMVFAVVAASFGEYMIAGVSFLAISFVIYFRETRV
jgi:hypothetical protein